MISNPKLATSPNSNSFPPIFSEKPANKRENIINKLHTHIHAQSALDNNDDYHAAACHFQICL
jgi:hypothetical protein